MPRAALLLLLLLAVCGHAQPPELPAAAPPPPVDAVSSPDWEADMRRFAAEDAARPPPRGAVLFVGSSSIRMWDLDAAFPELATVNRGFGGSQLRDATWYADRIILPYAPRTIVLYAGDNDLEAGRTPHQVREDFRAFVQRVRRGLPHARIVCLSIKPSPARAHLLQAVHAANVLLRQEAARWDRVEFVDVAAPMLDGGGQPRRELFLEDDLHLNAAGYALWRRLLLPHLRP